MCVVSLLLLYHLLFLGGTFMCIRTCTYCMYKCAHVRNIMHVRMCMYVRFYTYVRTYESTYMLAVCPVGLSDVHCILQARRQIQGP